MSACCRAAALSLTAMLACWCAQAWAYRPFDGTDAAVAESGQIEVEFGPAEYQREGASRTLFGPSAVFNYGFAPGWEAVVEGRVAHPLSGGASEPGLVDDGASLKTVLREGALQDKPSPSIAAEFGVLPPEIRGQRGTGASLAGVVSERWNWGTAHLNVAAASTRQHHADFFLSAIVEGPYDWPVRPVAEVFGEQEFGAARVASLLIGAVWQPKENVAVDFGLRGARVNSHTAAEIRAGITFALTAH